MVRRADGASRVRESGHDATRHDTYRRSTRHPLDLSIFRQLEPWEWIFAAVVVGWLIVLFWRGLTGLPALDTGLAYKGGQVAWATGHPERLSTWISSPFFALIMALTSRVLTENQTRIAVTFVNYAVLLALLPAIWVPLRRRVSPLFWWIALTAGLVFAPLASTLFWRQFNLIALAVGAAGFWLSARRPAAAGALVSLSIAVKPVIFLLPLAMIWKRDTRKTGVLTLVWGVAILIVSQLFLAWRAHSLRTLLPFAALSNFASKSLPSTNGWVCNAQNFSPESTMCRVVALGGKDWSATRDLTLVGVAGIVLVAALLLRRTEGKSWLIFAFACLLSPMLSPIAWSHYQLMMAPMFLVLGYDLCKRRGQFIEWLWVGGAYVLCELSWRPYGMIDNILQQLVRGMPERSLLPSGFVLLGFAQFAQYVLFFGAVLWFNRFNTRTGTGEQVAIFADGPSVELATAGSDAGGDRHDLAAGAKLLR
jgi:Glycosyltransferase family 87